MVILQDSGRKMVILQISGRKMVILQDSGRKMAILQVSGRMNGYLARFWQNLSESCKITIRNRLGNIKKVFLTNVFLNMFLVLYFILLSGIRIYDLECHASMTWWHWTKEPTFLIDTGVLIAKLKEVFFWKIFTKGAIEWDKEKTDQLICCKKEM